jgi:hypothetical protein
MSRGVASSTVGLNAYFVAFLRADDALLRAALAPAAAVPDACFGARLEIGDVGTGFFPPPGRCATFR